MNILAKEIYINNKKLEAPHRATYIEGYMLIIDYFGREIKETYLEIKESPGEFLFYGGGKEIKVYV